MGRSSANSVYDSILSALLAEVVPGGLGAAPGARLGQPQRVRELGAGEEIKAPKRNSIAPPRLGQPRLCSARMHPPAGTNQIS